MASNNTSADYLLNMLMTGKAKKIAISIFIAADPTKTILPPNIDPGAINLLKEIKGRIYPIALRGKCQAGKSTTLNRIAKLANIQIERLLEVAEGFGGSTTEGVWLMIITFNNNDTLLLFDVQGTDRGADELTHKLIALTDHICTKVVDVFRMPLEGFSNEYINSLYCLAMARDTVENLRATSHKTILWTNCVLPKRSPLKPRTFCNTPDEYQTELLGSSIGERAVQGAKAKSYAEKTSIITTKKPSDDILYDICQLENNHPFVAHEIMPVLKNILDNVQPVTFASHVINDGPSFVTYLNNVYTNIKASVIDLPFCALPMIRSIAMSLLKETKLSVTCQINEEISNNSGDMQKISHIMIPKIKDVQHRSIAEFKLKLGDLPAEHWQDQLKDLILFIDNKIREIVDSFKPNVLKHFLELNRPSLNRLCELGSNISKLRIDLQRETVGIVQKMESIPFLRGNISSLEKEFIERSLDQHQLNLCRAQEIAESDLQRRLTEFKQDIYSTEPEGIEEVIKNMIRDHKGFSQQQFSSFNIKWKPFYNENTMIKDLREDNIRRSNDFVIICQNKCIAEFNRQVGLIMSSTQNVSQKYGLLKIELEKCLHQYYCKLPWPLNDQTIQKVNDELKIIFNRVMEQLFTPEVRAQLQDERVAQIQALSRLNFDQNESLLWVYCVGCKRIFAGRTRGCVNVTCAHFDMKNGTKNNSHGCGLQFEWANAQPVPIEKIPPQVCFSNISQDERTAHVNTLMSSITNGLHSMYSAGAKVLTGFRAT